MIIDINKLYSSQALFNKTVDELNADEAKAFSIIESTIANRVKFEPYPIPDTVEDKHWRLFCVKRSFDPVSQQTHEMRLFLLVNMQSSVAVVLSYDAVKGSQHHWQSHLKKVEQGLQRLMQASLLLGDCNTSKEPKTSHTELFSTNETKKVADDTLHTIQHWLQNHDDDSILTKKNIIECIELLVESLWQKQTKLDNVKTKLMKKVSEAMKDQRFAVVMQPHPLGFLLSLRSPNREMNSVISLDKKRVKAFFHDFVELAKPHFNSSNEKATLQRCLLQSFSMSPKYTLSEVQALASVTHFDDAEQMNDFLNDGLFSYYQGQLSADEFMQMCLMVRQGNVFLFTDQALILPIMKFFHDYKVSDDDNSVAESSQSSTHAMLSRLSISEFKPLYQSFCLSLCERFSEQEFLFYCNPQNPYRDKALLNLMLMKSGDVDKEKIMNFYEGKPIFSVAIDSSSISASDSNSSAATSSTSSSRSHQRKNKQKANQGNTDRKPKTMKKPLTIESFKKMLSGLLNKVNKQQYNPKQQKKSIDDFMKTMKSEDLNALTRGYSEAFSELIFDFFFRHQCKLNLLSIQQTSLFDCIAYTGHFAAFEFVCRHADLKQLQTHGLSAVSLLAASGDTPGHVKCLELAMKYHFDLNPEPSEYYNSPISALLSRKIGSSIHAGERMQIKMLKILVKGGADLNYPCIIYGFHALQLAVCAEAPLGVIKTLLQLGAKSCEVIDLDAAHGTIRLTALDLALGLKCYRNCWKYAGGVIQLLRTYGGKLQSGAYDYVLRASIDKSEKTTGVVLPTQRQSHYLPEGKAVSEMLYEAMSQPTVNFDALQAKIRQVDNAYVDEEVLLKLILLKKESLAIFAFRNIPCIAHRSMNLNNNVIHSLFSLAISVNATRIVKYLLDDGANPNNLLVTTDNFVVETMLHFCIVLGNPDIMKMLLDYGASTDENIYLGEENFRPFYQNGKVIISSKTKYGHVPLLEYACNLNNHELGLMLENYKSTGEFVVTDAIRFRQSVIRGDLDAVKALMHSDYLNEADSYVGNTALHLAYLKNQQSIIQYLEQECGADTSIKNKEGLIPAECHVDYATQRRAFYDKEAEEKFNRVMKK